MYLMGLSWYLSWRKGWDSNPRTGSSPITRFRVERVTASSLPFHNGVLYTNCRLRASLFSRGCAPEALVPNMAERSFSASSMRSHRSRHGPASNLRPSSGGDFRRNEAPKAGQVRAAVVSFRPCRHEAAPSAPPGRRNGGPCGVWQESALPVRARKYRPKSP